MKAAKDVFSSCLPLYLHPFCLLDAGLNTSPEGGSWPSHTVWAPIPTPNCVCMDTSTQAASTMDPPISTAIRFQKEQTTEMCMSSKSVNSTGKD